MTYRRPRCRVFLLRPDRGAVYCDERVCLSVCVCVCLSAIVSSGLHVQSLPIFVHVTYGRGSVLRISGFTDNVSFAIS